MNSPILSGAVLQLACFLFCLVVGMFIASLVLERIVFYIPRLGVLVKEGVVFHRSVIVTVVETVSWTAVVVALYLFWYAYFPFVFPLVTTGPVALVAWGICLIRMVYRFVFFGRTVKRDFYYTAYMHYITPQALHDYQVFIEELDDMDDAQLEAQAALDKTLPYMHQQAVQRKMGERGIWESWKKANQKIDMFSLFQSR